MKALLFGLAAFAVGVGIVVWAAKRSVDFNDAKKDKSPVPVPSAVADAAEVTKRVDVLFAKLAVQGELTDRGEPWWPLWATGEGTN